MNAGAETALQEKHIPSSSTLLDGIVTADSSKTRKNPMATACIYSYYVKAYFNKN